MIGNDPMMLGVIVRAVMQGRDSKAVAATCSVRIRNIISVRLKNAVRQWKCVHLYSAKLERAHGAFPAPNYLLLQRLPEPLE